MEKRFGRGALVAVWLVSAVAAEPASAVTLHRAFVTSVTGTGNLSSWANAGGKSGLAAADAVCQARATAGGLPNPTNFVAWMSDATSDAYCRVHGLTGKMSANCGQGALPTTAGPWVRVDGYPFASTIQEAISLLAVYTPLALNEYGAVVHDLTWTGSESSGGVDTGGDTCSNWTSSSSGGLGKEGNSFTTGSGWIYQSASSCSATARLACLEKGAGAPLPEIVTSGRVAFLTSSFGTGALSTWADAAGQTGLAAGDAICRARANAAGVPHAPSFKAWLSKSGSDAAARLMATSNWARLDGIPVATNKSDLLDGTLFAPMNQTELGTYIGNYGVWTGTSASGTSTGSDCSQWFNQASAGTATSGNAQFTDVSWTDQWGGSACNYSAGHLYCLSDTAIVYALAVPITVGGTVSLNGNGITAGSKLKVFVATSSGPVDVAPDGISPTTVTSSTWSGTLPWPWPVGGQNAKLLGNGFVSLELVQTDLGYNATDPVGDVLLGSASLGVPTITSIGGVSLSSTSFQLSIGTANVQGLVARGSPLSIVGSGFASPVVNVFTASGNVGPLTPTSSTSTSITVNIPAGAPIGPGSFQVVNTTTYQPSNAVSIPIGELVTVTNVAVNGGTVNVTGTGFNALTVINLFASKGGVLTNVGGFSNGQTPNVPLTVADAHHFSFTRPAGLDAGGANLQAINPPFIPYTTSSSGGGFTLP